MMGIVSDEELQKELNKNVTPGRKLGDVNVPEALRKVLAQDAIENGRESALALADSMGISASSVSAYTNGSTSTTTYNQRNSELNNANNAVRTRIAGKARRVLLRSLREITPEKLKQAKLRDVSAVARDMAAVVHQMSPKENDEAEGRGPKVNINIFAPARKVEADYETIDVTE